METTRLELAALEEITRELENELKELADTQLALIGGGIGEVIVA